MAGQKCLKPRLHLPGRVYCWSSCFWAAHLKKSSSSGCPAHILALRQRCLTRESAAAEAVEARLGAMMAGGKAEQGAAELLVPHTNFGHELDKSLSSFCRRCRIYSCVTHAGPHVRCCPDYQCPAILTIHVMNFPGINRPVATLSLRTFPE